MGSVLFLRVGDDLYSKLASSAKSVTLWVERQNLPLLIAVSQFCLSIRVINTLSVAINTLLTQPHLSSFITVSISGRESQVNRLFIIIPILLSSACSNTPVMPAQPNMGPVTSATANNTKKQVLRADPQWNAIANEVIYCVKALALNENELKQQSIYVAKPENRSPEIKAFRSVLMTKLVQNGFNITYTSTDAYQLNYDVVPNDPGESAGVDANVEVLVRVALIKGDKVMTIHREMITSADDKWRTRFVHSAKNL